MLVIISSNVELPYSLLMVKQYNMFQTCSSMYCEHTLKHCLKAAALSWLKKLKRNLIMYVHFVADVYANISQDI